MPAESETYEEKSVHEGTDREKLRIIKTIISMANTRGGQIIIGAVTSGRRYLDSASLDNVVNRYAGPGLHGITSEKHGDNGVGISVPESPNKPHITRQPGQYKESGESKFSFHRGQIWVRHGSSNAEATPDDLRQLLYDAAGRLLERVGAQIRQPSFIMRSDDDAAIAVRLTGDENAMLVRADLTITYPHTRRSLAEDHDTSVPWIACAMKTLDLEGPPELSYADRNSAGHPVQWRYSEEARQRLSRELSVNPKWDPRATSAV